MSSRDARRAEGGARTRDLEREARPSSRGPDGYRERERERDRRGEDGLGSSSSRHRDHHYREHSHSHHREHSHSHSRARSTSRHERERERERLPGPPDRGQLPSSSGTGPLPPPPPLLSRGSSGRMQGGQVSTPPHKQERGEPVARGGTPGSASRDGAQGTPGPGGGPLPSNSFLAEVMKHSKQIYRAKGSAQDRGGSGEDGEANGDVDDREAGEIDNQEAPGRKRKHSPIVWDPIHAHKQPRSASSSGAHAPPEAGPSARAHTRASSEEDSRGGGPWESEGRPGSRSGRREGGGYDLYERAANEAAELRRRQMEEGDWDPEAPPAMKPSPSGSEGESPAHRGEENGHDSHAEDDETMAEPSTKGIASRWLMDNGDEEEEAGAGAKRKGGGDERASSASPAASAEAERAAQGQGVGPGGALPTSEAGDYELDDDSASPGQGGKHMQYDMRRECRSVDEFEKIDRISEGTYGVVYRAREKATGRIVALKRVKMEKERDGFPVTSVREISILLNFHHANIVNVEEVVISPKNPDHIFMVMEYMDHDLKSLMDDKQQMSRPFSVAESKCLMLQLLSGVSFLHQHWVLHRDIKTSNILYNSKGDLKLCDFGMARQYGDPLVPYTHLVVTLWYRAPELLLGQQLYSTAVDVWSCGCIMAEILTGKPLMPGHGELDQLDKMVQVLGTPTEEIWPGIKKLPNYGKVNLKQMPSQLRQRFTSGASFGGGGATLTEAGFDLLSRLLTWDPEQRITTEEALQHRWFSEPPLPQKKELMPMFAPRRAG